MLRAPLTRLLSPEHCHAALLVHFVRNTLFVQAAIAEAVAAVVVDAQQRQTQRRPLKRTKDGEEANADATATATAVADSGGNDAALRTALRVALASLPAARRRRLLDARVRFAGGRELLVAFIMAAF